MRFIARTSLAGLVPLVVGDRPLLEDYVRLQDLLRARGGEPASRLFAQPVITWGNGANPGSVAWYTDAAGEAERLAGLPDARQAVIGGRLQAALAALWPMRSDPLVAAALTLASPDGVMAVGDEPVLIGWGLAASDQPGPAAAAALAAAFGPYLPAAPPPVPVVMSPPVPPLPPPAIPIPVAPALPLAGRELPWLLPAGLAVLAVCLALGIWFGLGMFARRTSFAELGDPATVRAAIDLAEAQNRGLAAAIAAQRKALAGNVCRLASTSAAGPLAAPVAPSALPPAPAAAKPFHGSLLDLLHQATVMVAASAGPGRIVTGSGFFFAPDLVLTNRHVVAEAHGPIEVISKALGHPVAATIVTETPNSAFFHPDFAVLRVAAAPGIQPLAFTPAAAQLDQVIATGFPGAFLLEAGNQAYAQLAGVMGGDMAQMPAMIATEGRISAIQTAPSGLMVMPHTAQISSGNSGGPLIDACGRVVGINTFTRTAARQIVHINYAQKTDSALVFLGAHQLPFTALKTPCTPAAAPPAPLPASPASPGPTAPK